MKIYINFISENTDSSNEWKNDDNKNTEFINISDEKLKFINNNDICYGNGS
jgi:hypothetical protein